MYLGPGVLGEFVPIYEQVVDVMGWEAVGAGVGLVEVGNQVCELKWMLQRSDMYAVFTLAKAIWQIECDLKQNTKNTLLRAGKNDPKIHEITRDYNDKW